MKAQRAAAPLKRCSSSPLTLNTTSSETTASVQHIWFKLCTERRADSPEEHVGTLDPGDSGLKPQICHSSDLQAENISGWETADHSFSLRLSQHYFKISKAEEVQTDCFTVQEPEPAH